VSGSPPPPSLLPGGAGGYVSSRALYGIAPHYITSALKGRVTVSSTMNSSVLHCIISHYST
jgi:hypothetical protein